MGGFHALDLIVIVGIALLLFGPKTLQSISHTAGRGMGQAKGAKNKILAELPMEDLSQINQTISQIPMNPQQAAYKLIAPSAEQDGNKAQAAQEKPELPVQEQK